MSESRKSGQYPPFKFQTQPRTDMNVSGILVFSICILETVHKIQFWFEFEIERGILTTFPRFRHKLLPFKDSFPR